MSGSRLAELETALHKRVLVRLARRFEDSLICGYVLAMGPEFFLFLLVSDRIRFDGFECFRLKDILSVQVDPYAVFIEAALKRRGQRKPRKPRISLDSIEDLLRTAGSVFPLLAIHMEKKSPDVCYIGHVCKVAETRLSLQCITPMAEWEATPSHFPLARITRVNFAGDYENALYLVGGDAPGVTG